MQPLSDFAVCTGACLKEHHGSSRVGVEVPCQCTELLFKLAFYAARNSAIYWATSLYPKGRITCIDPSQSRSTTSSASNPLSTNRPCVTLRVTIGSEWDTQHAADALQSERAISRDVRTLGGKSRILGIGGF